MLANHFLQQQLLLPAARKQRLRINFSSAHLFNSPAHGAAGGLNHELLMPPEKSRKLIKIMLRHVEEVPLHQAPEAFVKKLLPSDQQLVLPGSSAVQRRIHRFGAAGGQKPAPLRLIQLVKPQNKIILR